MRKMTGGEHEQLIIKFEELTTTSKGLCGNLQRRVGDFQAKEMVLRIFKV